MRAVHHVSTNTFTLPTSALTFARTRPRDRETNSTSKLVLFKFTLTVAYPSRPPRSVIPIAPRLSHHRPHEPPTRRHAPTIIRIRARLRRHQSEPRVPAVASASSPPSPPPRLHLRTCSRTKRGSSASPPTSSPHTSSTHLIARGVVGRARDVPVRSPRNRHRHLHSRRERERRFHRRVDVALRMRERSSRRSSRPRRARARAPRGDECGGDATAIRSIVGTRGRGARVEASARCRTNRSARACLSVTCVREARDGRDGEGRAREGRID